MDWLFALQCIAAFVAILNPLGAVPVYLGMVAAGPGDDLARRRMARNATLTVLVTLVVFAGIGQAVLTFFGITVPAFRVGGGILLLLTAVSMLHGRMGPTKQTPEEADAVAERESVAIVPLGLPILAGPGSITTSILLAQRADSWRKIVALCLGIAVATAAVYLTLRLADRLQRRLGRNEIGIANRVMGLILAAVAVQFMADGLRELFPLLSQPH